MDWGAGESYCSELKDGGVAWRLPSEDELLGMVSKVPVSNAFAPAGAVEREEPHTAWYWSNIRVEKPNAVVVSLVSGATARLSVGLTAGVWCVRDQIERGSSAANERGKPSASAEIDSTLDGRPGKHQKPLLTDSSSEKVDQVAVSSGPGGRSDGSATATDIPAPTDVSAPPDRAQRTSSGLASKVLMRGPDGAHPGPTDIVTVHYTGWTTDGKMFDSSVKRGKPTEFPLNRVIAGWTEAVQLMVKGEKRRFWIPQELAYKGRPGAPAGMLVFDVELLSFRKAPPPLPIPPVPSDVAAPPRDAARTTSGLATRIIFKGRGAERPTKTSVVEVHYVGWTTDGKMFDNSYQRGETTKFPLNKVIPGWTEGLQLMVEGEKRRLWIPEALAYNGTPGAPAGMLVFDVELVRIAGAASVDAGVTAPSTRVDERPATKAESSPAQTKKCPEGFVLIPAGTFDMGSASGPAEERPVHRVSISAFCMAQSETTVAEWRRVMGDIKPWSDLEGDLHPVTVDFGLAVWFCNNRSRQDGLRPAYGSLHNRIPWANGYRLPTESEWEYAARAGYVGATYGPIDDVAWHWGNSDRKSHEVMKKKPNAWGLYDMLGNASEFTGDWIGLYGSDAVHDPVGAPRGDCRVERGGSHSDMTDMFSVSRRSASCWYAQAGFRLVLPLLSNPLQEAASMP